MVLSNPIITNQIITRDETLRDGNQGEAPRSAFRGVAHLIAMCPSFDMMSIGWIYTNPADTEIARYLREHGVEMAAKNKHLKTDKFLIYTLVHRGQEKNPDEVSDQIPFGAMLRDLQSGRQPYGTINILGKARVSDLKDFGAEVTSESFKDNILNTMRLIRQANRDVKIEIALEHFFTAWLESEGQAVNRKHIVDTLAAALAEGAVRITVPDTDGAHTPEEIGRVIREVTAALSERIPKFLPSMFTAHMHDDLGHAAANTRAALEAGAGAFDTTVGKMGERMGNGTLNDIVTMLGYDERFLPYQNDLQRVLGVSPDDKTIGSAQAFCGTGGMHADHALKELWKFVDSGNGSYDNFVRQYNGSYASVPPSRFSQKLQMTLSPVAGAANVLFMLAGLGMDVRDKKDPRIAEVLKEIKDGEHQRAVNYRGYNNTNAFLLLAEKFGLCNAETSLQVTPSKNQHSKETVVLDLHMKRGGKKIDTWLGVSPDSTHKALLESDEKHDPHVDGAEFLKAIASGLLRQAKKSLTEVDKRFEQLELKDLRVLEGPVGSVRPGNGDVLKPEAEKMKSAVKLIFTTGGQERFQANGSGNTYEEALGMALQTALNFKCLQIEREQGKVSVPTRP